MLYVKVYSRKEKANPVLWTLKENQESDRVVNKSSLTNKTLMNPQRVFRKTEIIV